MKSMLQGKFRWGLGGGFAREVEIDAEKGQMKNQFY
jgi:hypothetical protein